MKKQKEKEQAKKVLEKITDLYVFLIIVIFPLIVNKTGFFHILECKWYSFITISSIYLLSIILVYFYYLWFKKENALKNWKPSKIQWLAIIFLIINIISCFTSPFFKNYNLWVGVGRGEGLIIQTLYILSFLVVSIFYRFKKKHILYFSISSILINTVAVLQYLGFNPLNMYQDGIGIYNVSFLTTIGNIDFVSAIYCILVTISIAAYIFQEEENKKEKAIHLLSVLLGFMMISIIEVASGKLAMFATLVIVFPFIVLNNKRLSRFINIIGIILLAYGIDYFLNPQYHYKTGIYRLYPQIDFITLLFIIICISLFVLSRVIKKYKYDHLDNKKIIKGFYIFILCCGFLGVATIFLFDFKINMLHEIHELLHGNFNDDFGTYRIFLWRRTLQIFPEFPILGSGPDTFVIRFMDKFTQDIIALGEYSLNDTAANVYLTMLINLGIVGLGTYIAFLTSQIINGVKKMNPYSKILLIGLLCYMIQDFFNLSVVIITPIYWVLMAVHYGSTKDCSN